MATTLDIAALITGLAWPIVMCALAWWYREPLSKFIAEVPRSVKSFKAAGFEVQLAEARSAPPVTEGAVDLRHAGIPSDVNDSTLASFYKQVQDSTRTDYVVVDLGAGAEWLSSRLYILSVILGRMRGLRAIVFVENDATLRRKLVGVCECDPVRWRLAAKWPRYESALAAAELSVWGHPYDMGPIAIPRPPGSPLPPIPSIPSFAESQSYRIVDENGRFDYPEAAARLLREFLDAIQRPVPAPSDDWQELSSTPNVAEYAVWLTGALIDQVLVGSLEKRSVRVHDYQGWSEQLRVRAFVEQLGDWVAVTRENGAFDRLINRREILEKLAAQVAKAAGG